MKRAAWWFKYFLVPVVLAPLAYAAAPLVIKVMTG
jgi:hypothetical protein